MNNEQTLSTEISNEPTSGVMVGTTTDCEAPEAPLPEPIAQEFEHLTSIGGDNSQVSWLFSLA